MATRLNAHVECERPKSLKQISVKLPEELVEDLNESRFLWNPPKTLSDVVKDRCEAGGVVRIGSRLGFYTLRGLEKNLNTF